MNLNRFFGIWIFMILLELVYFSEFISRPGHDAEGIAFIIVVIAVTLVVGATMIHALKK
jgi:hypothetical protein